MRSHGSYSTSDLSRKSGDIIAEAPRRPVVITQRNKPRLVLLNIEDHQRLTRQSDPRSVGAIETMPDDLFAEVEAAIHRLRQPSATIAPKSSSSGGPARGHAILTAA